MSLWEISRDHARLEYRKYLSIVFILIGHDLPMGVRVYVAVTWAGGTFWVC